jgi:tRNA(Arg) A34 adenosine deaminase TadA
VRDRKIAWIDHASVRYFAASCESDFAIESSVLRLINGVYETCGTESLRVLRNRIFTTFDPSPVERRVVKLAAKRIQCVEANLDSIGSSRQIDLSHLPLTDLRAERGSEFIGTLLSQTDAVNLCRSIGDQVQISKHRYESPRKVAAILLGPKMQLVAAAVNSNELNRFRHAEVNLVSQFFAQTRSLIPPGCVVITSLSPCRMCAQVLASMASDGANLRVIALERDSGRYGCSNDLNNQLILA